MPPMNDFCIMYLIRHGATDVNTANPPRLQGRGVNLGLSDVGRQQAERTANFLAQRKLTAIYGSPLRRSQETARIIARPHGLNVQTLEQIIEVDVGHWEGRSWIDIEKDDPEYYQRYMNDPGSVPYAGGESFQNVQDRALPALQRVMEENPAGRIVVVAHNIVNRAYLAALLTLPVAKARMISQDNCGINIVWHKDGQMKLRTTNATFHLED